ncbi:MULTISPECIES: signal peptidase I [Leptospira]|uniref:Signal peptidase I n=1 Tax=Leptospira borgpetersenii serovar Javanica str. UI 09931 TaxID=1049767 RepID=A0AAV3J6P0_LEPBO|nr:MULTISPECIES: signal peptidase I [Leptospira]AXX16158.1 signal peptidase I [Leptospira borgpetersenii serovar Ceylonica]EKQ90400.1 signal peptidase I [Leptospira borgpetersenii str. UI 09149]EMK08849.1 signal peptidase I [Leptospira sp. serovar Kenya str. Sh9]EMN58523.1 signal peptidase I [Leptospira borgpetersenii serovar Javanica str. MK146]EPG56421.1 signal peptidase I [Leptospira borgpetersenii serovar Javanica str. UI 09931]
MSGSSSNQEKREKIKSILKQAGIGLSIGLITASLIRFFLFFPFTLETKEMLPTYSPGKRIYFSRFVNRSNLYLGDLVLVKHPTQEGKVVFSRIVGKPGDTVQMKNKILYRNNNPEDSSGIGSGFVLQFEDKRGPFPASFSSRDNSEPLILKDRDYFLLCDNRDSCSDSRDFGPIPIEYILGKAL